MVQLKEEKCFFETMWNAIEEAYFQKMERGTKFTKVNELVISRDCLNNNLAYNWV